MSQAFRTAIVEPLSNPNFERPQITAKSSEVYQVSAQEETTPCSGLLDIVSAQSAAHVA